MNQIKVKWDKVSPADLSSTCCAQYFAFSRNNEVFHINEVSQKCLFTKVIQTSANYSCSIYDIDIWVGYVVEDLGLSKTPINTEELLGVLEWTAKVQLKGMNKEELQELSVA